MKKNLLFLLLMIASILPSFAQLVPNGSFENWTMQHFYDEPNFGITTNWQTYVTTGVGNVMKTTDSHTGSFAANLTTVVAGNDTMPGAIFIGTPDSGSFNGGIPCIVRPDSLRLYAKFNIMPGDTATVLVLFKDSGVYIGSTQITFTGSQSNYQYFHRPIYWTDTTSVPDTLVGIFTSSVFDNSGSIPGSTITIDDIGFVGAAGAPSTGFETWVPVESLEPDEWTTLNFLLVNQTPSVTQSTDAYDGTYALQIVNVLTPSNDTLGFATNGTFGFNDSIPFIGGMAVSQNPMAVQGYYKYNPVGSDTALVGVYVTFYDPGTGNTIKLDSALTWLLPTNTYTPFYVPIQYNNWPTADTLNITFAAGNYYNDSNFVGIGSTLLVDKVEVLYNPVSVQPFEFSKAQNVYPNPANNVLNISNIKGNTNQYFRMFDAKGTCVFESKFYNRPGEISQLDISSITNGFYMYQIIDGNSIIKGKLTIQH